MVAQEQKTKQLAEAIKSLMIPITGVPFHVAVKVFYGCQVIPPNPRDLKDQKLLKDLGEVARIATINASRRGIFRNRPNEVGNDIEAFVRAAMTDVGYLPQTPMTSSGAGKAMGYPDIYCKDRFGRHIYLECKTYNKETVATTQRSFYFSLSRKEEAKIIRDARHIVLSFEIEQTERQGKRCYIPAGWKIVSIDSMKVSVKHEFNASNKDMHRRQAVLVEGRI